MARRKSDSPQKAAMREMMQGYLKENDISIKSGNDVNFIMRDMMWIFLLRETLIPEMWKPVFRNTETVLIGLMDIYRVQLICQAQSRFAVRSRLYDWVETDKLVLLQSHTFLGSLMPDSMDMVAGIFIMSVLLEGALDEELNEELGYSKYDYQNKETDNSRNGHSKKTMRTSYGDMDIAIPRDRKGVYEPQLIPKYQNTVTQDMEEI